MRSGRCFNCLKPNHRAQNCDRMKKCRFCQRRHHQSICENQSFGSQELPTDVPTTQAEAINTCTNVKNKQLILLQTARATAVNRDVRCSLEVRILFDSGSQRSYVTNALKTRLKLNPIKVERLNLNTFGEGRFKKQNCDVVRLCLCKPGSNEAIPIEALSFPKICSPPPSHVDLTKLPKLQDLNLADYSSSTSHDVIDILVGSDYYWSIVTGEVMKTETGLVAVNSKLGWLLSGPTDSCTTEIVTHSNLVISSVHPEVLTGPEDDKLHSMLNCFWETESYGTHPESTVDCSHEDFLPGLQFVDSHYQVNLPWNHDKSDLPTHYQLCYNRLRSLQNKLLHKPALMSEYQHVIQDQLDRGIIEPVDVTAQGVQAGHYMPHHPVIREDKKTTKVRVVYDGSAKMVNFLSLNDCLQKGPNLIPKLFNILIKFRSYAITLTADIEKAFLMIGINESDRDYLRFLWLKHPKDRESEVMHLRFTRLVFGLKLSPAVLGAVIAHHVEKYREMYPKAAGLLEESLYVDDLVAGAGSVDEAFNLYLNCKTLMKEGGFNLRKWNSNSTALKGKIGDHEGAAVDCVPKPSEIFTSEVVDDEAKLLGVQWDSETDIFRFDFNELQNFALNLPLCKRSILRVSAGVFDPLGFLNPFTVRLKMIFQLLCTSKQSWDEPLEGELLEKWKTIIEEFVLLNCITIQRYYFKPQDPVQIQVHGFCDASQYAYAAVIYVRSLYADGTVEMRLVASKTKIAPVKRQSIPRLELLGALILARLTSVVKPCIQSVAECFLWTDSMTALYWIKNSKVWKQYVHHRVEEIRRLTIRSDWKHCPGSINPADLPSRGITARQLVNSTLWWTGPPFLQQEEQLWPHQEVCESTDEVYIEMLKNSPPITLSMVTNTYCIMQSSIDEIIDCTEYSNFHHLLRVTANVVRFVKILKARIKRDDNFEPGPIRAAEMNEAELIWIRIIQSKTFALEIQFICNNHVDEQRKPLLVSQFGLFYDETDHVIRCRGRINNSSLPTNVKNPILLPHHHHLVKLLIQCAHIKLMHSGVRDTLVQLRERYWILKGRQAVRSVIRSCVICRRYEGAFYPAIPSPDLPEIRVSDDPPFTHTGLDFAGPLFFQSTSSTHDSVKEKAYICLFTCASTRGIHLELTQGLDVEAFLMAFRRFTSRRGVPATLISDNAKTFKASSTQIAKIRRSTEVSRYLIDNQITWTFIVERAPWWGGFWERLIQSVKRCLRKVIGRNIMKFEQLRTLLVEVEGIVNARPLTYVHDDTEGISYTLCPAHLLYGRRICHTPNSQHFEIVSTFQTLTKKWKSHKQLLNQFTTQWRKDYLLNLRECHAVSSKKESRPMIEVGQLVILKDDLTKRVFWKLAIVDELLPGRDGKIRAVKVKVPNEKGSTSTLRRSIQHLIPLEIKTSIE